MNNPRVVVKAGISQRDKALLQACEDWRGWSMILAVFACLIACIALVVVAFAPGRTVGGLVWLALGMVAAIALFIQNVVWPLHWRSRLIRKAEAVILPAPYDQHYDEQMLHLITKKPADQCIRLQRYLVGALWNILQEQARITRVNLQQCDGWEQEILEASNRQKTIWGSYLKMVDSVADRTE